MLRREVARRIATGEVTAPETPEGGELNLDSLGRVELQAQLEQQYGISLDDAAFEQVKTKDDVHKLLTGTPAVPAPQKTRRLEHIYPHWPWNPVMQAIRSAFLELIAMPLVRFLAKPRVVSKVRAWPSAPLLIVANHITTYDAPFILYALPGRIRRRVAIATWGEMLLDWRRARNQGHWFLNAVAPIEYLLVTALFNIFPLPQQSGFRRSFWHAGEAIDRGYSVLVFPEGRRAENEAPQPFKSGAGLLWKELGMPALPVRLEGLGEIKATRGRWFRAGNIGVTVGEILPLDSSKSPEELTEVLRAGVFG